MKVVSLSCNHCGAPLDVPAKARFVTCGFCNARLAIEHSGNTYWTSVLDEIKEKTDRLERDVAEIKRTSAVEQLDASWDRKRQFHLVTGKKGHTSLPTKSGAIAAGVIGGGFGLVWTLIAVNITGGRGVGLGGSFFGLFPLFGLFFIAAAIFNAFRIYSKADRYERDLRKYRAERRRLFTEREP